MVSHFSTRVFDLEGEDIVNEVLKCIDLEGCGSDVENILERFMV